MDKTKNTNRKKKFTKKAIMELFDGIALELEKVNRHDEAKKFRDLKALY
jgi:transposase